MEWSNLYLCSFKTLSDDSLVKTFTDINVSLLQKLSDEQDRRSCAIACDVILIKNGDIFN